MLHHFEFSDAGHSTAAAKYVTDKTTSGNIFHIALQKTCDGQSLCYNSATSWNGKTCPIPSDENYQYHFVIDIFVLQMIISQLFLFFLF